MNLMNPFAILNIKQDYDIDQDDLEIKYLTLQMMYHPDKATSDLEQKRFISLSIDINNSYKILKNDYDRAIVLLKLENIDTNSVLLSDDFLEQMLEKNEELNDISDIKNLREFMEYLNKNYQIILSNLSDSFKMQNYDLASRKVIEMKYISNLITNAKEKHKCLIN